MAFNVFVEGATDGSPEGVARLAEAIAKQYGLPAADLLARLQKGRFRVKGNIDRATAETYVRDLARLGARCTIEEASGDTSTQKIPALQHEGAGSSISPGARPSTPPPTGSSAGARPSTPPPNASPLGSAAPKPAPAAGAYQSGLAAAFSGEMPAASLGALEREDAALALASVDGADESAAPAAGSFAPPGGLSASIGPAPEKAKASKGADKPKDTPVDMFLPPDAQGDELKVELADDDFAARKRTSTPPPMEDAPPPARTSQQMAPVRASQQMAPVRASQQMAPVRASQQMAPVQAEGIAARSKLGPLGDERVRFVAGVFLALGLGFLPAHFVAKSREDSAYREIDSKVIATQQLAETPEAYAMLDRMRALQLDKKEDERRSAAIIAIAVWALLGGAIAFVWFKKVPWDSLDA